MDIEQLIEHVRASRGEVRYSDFQKVANHFGYSLKRISGSHHVFMKPSMRPFPVPVHRKKIKKVYVDKFLKEIGR